MYTNLVTREVLSRKNTRVMGDVMFEHALAPKAASAALAAACSTLFNFVLKVGDS